MYLAGGDRIEQRRKTPYEARRRNSTKRLVFGEAKLIDAVRVEARACSRPMNATCLDFSEVRQEPGD
jgi:hypothetical protein